MELKQVANEGRRKEISSFPVENKNLCCFCLLFEYHICHVLLFTELFLDLLVWKAVEGTGDFQDAGQDLDSKSFAVTGNYVCSLSFLRENKE